MQFIEMIADVIWVIISVSEGGLLSVTQQMQRFRELGSASPLSSTSPAIHVNPFANPNNSIIRFQDNNNSNQMHHEQQQQHQNHDEESMSSDNNVDNNIDSWG